jgi:hypothetical protein
MVEITDEAGNTITWETVPPVSIEVTGPRAADTVLSGCGATTPIDGVAHFTGCKLTCMSGLDCLGTDHKLKFRNVNCDSVIVSLESAAFTLSEGPNTLVVRAGTTPGAATAGEPLTQPVVELWSFPCGTNAESSCHVDAAAPGITVTAALEGTEAPLRGATAALAVDGVARFTDLALSTAAGAPYNLSLSAPGFPPLFMDVTVAVGPAARIVVAAQPAPTEAGAPFTAGVEIHDAGGNLVTDASEQVSPPLPY